MRKFAVCIALFFVVMIVSSPRAFSQVEVFGGYSRLFVNNSANINTGSPSSSSVHIGDNFGGWIGSASVHLIGYLSAEADFSNHYGINRGTATESGRFFAPGFTQLYGPRFEVTKLHHFDPFVHVLFGTVHGTRSTPTSPQTCIICTSTPGQNAFAFDVGGGLDLQVAGPLWVRLFQADYIRTEFTGNTQNNAQLAGGLVLRFGKW